MTECPLCKREIKTELKYEDHVCWIAKCASHPDKWLIVLKRHTSVPLVIDLEHMTQLAWKLFPGKAFRGPASILDHFHLHEA